MRSPVSGSLQGILWGGAEQDYSHRLLFVKSNFQEPAAPFPNPPPPLYNALKDTMAYNEVLAQRVREALNEQPGITEKKMFGGIAFLLNGNMACGVLQNELLVRVGPEQYTEAVAQRHTRPFDIAGRLMTGWIMVSSAGYQTNQALHTWLQQSLAFATSLPAK